MKAFLKDNKGAGIGTMDGFSKFGEMRLKNTG